MYYLIGYASLLIIGFWIVMKNSPERSPSKYSNIVVDTSSKSQNTFEEKPVLFIDTARIKELKTHFIFKEDEFQSSNIVWVKHKSNPNDIAKNRVYCYFYLRDGQADNFRFVIQYDAEDWLFFNRVQFLSDGNVWEYTPEEKKTNVGQGGHIQEWNDQKVSPFDQGFLTVLASANTVKMKLNGTNFHDVRTLSKSEIKAINQTLDYYTSLGGKF